MGAATVYTRSRSVLTLVIFSFALTSVFLTWIVLSLYKSTKTIDYHLQSVAVEESILKFLHSNKSLVGAYQAFIAASSEVTPEEFEIFSHSIVRDMPQIRNASVVKQVLASERADFEAELRESGLEYPYISRRLERIPAEADDEYYPLIINLDFRPEQDGSTKLGADLVPLIKQANINVNDPQTQSSFPYLSTNGEIHYLLLAPIGSMDNSGRNHLISFSVAPIEMLERIVLEPGFMMTLGSERGASPFQLDIDKTWRYSGPPLQNEFRIPMTDPWREVIPLQLGTQEFALNLTRQYTIDPAELGLIVVLLIANLAIHTLWLIAQKNRLLRVRADAANEAKGQFLAMMSHEIRTPMNGVLGMADVLRQTSLTQNQKQYLDVIINSGKSLLTVINDVLDTSKIEAGKLDLEYADYNFHEMIADLSEVYSISRQDEAQQFVASIAPGTPVYLHGDAVRLRQILANLLSNAFKFTERGLISLRVESVIEVDAGNSAAGAVVSSNSQGDLSTHDGVVSPQLCHLTLKVSDEGIGIEPQKAGSLFQSFYQADTSIYRKYGGTGLGLAICKKLVSMMDGKISVSSQLRKGSCFTVTLSLPVCENQPLPGALPEGSRLLLCDLYAPSRACLLEQAEALALDVTLVDSMTSLRQLLSTADLKPYDYIVLVPGFQTDVITDFLNLLEEHAIPADSKRLLLSDVLASHIQSEVDYSLFDHVAGLPVSCEQLAEELLFATGEASSTLHELRAAKKPSPLRAKDQLRILVVEDNPVNSQVIQAMLKNLGHLTQMVDNGYSAIDYFSRYYDEVDLVLMDCEMPVLDGFSTTEKMRQFEASQGQARKPVIAVTAHVLPQFEERCKKAGMDYFLSKPLTLKKLSAMLANILRPESA